MADDNGILPPANAQATALQKKNAKTAAATLAGLIAARVAPKTAAPIAKYGFGVVLKASGAVRSFTPLALTNFLPQPFGLIPAENFGLKPNYYLPSEGAGDLPNWLPGVAEQRAEDKARSDAANAKSIYTDEQIIRAAQSNFSPERFAELVAATRGGANPLGLANPQKAVAGLVTPGATPMPVQYAGPPKVHTPRREPGPIQLDTGRSDVLDRAAQAGEMIGQMFGVSGAAQNQMANRAALAENKRQNTIKELVENPGVVPEAVQQTITGGTIAGGVAGLTPGQAAVIGRNVGQQHLDQLAPDVAKAVEAARKKNQPAAPSTSPSPGAPVAPGAPPGQEPVPTLPAAPSVSPSGAPGNTTGQDRYNEPNYPPSGAFPDKFFTRKHGDP